MFPFSWESHHSAPLPTSQSASAPESSVAATRPNVGWCPTINIGPGCTGHSAAAMTSAARASVPTASEVVNDTPSASAVCCARAAGLTRISQPRGRRGSSQAATRLACSLPRSVSRRAESGLPSSVSACRHRIMSIFCRPFEHSLRSSCRNRSEEYYPQTPHLLKEPNNGQGRRSLQNHRSDRNQPDFVGGRGKESGRDCVQDFARPAHRGGGEAGLEDRKRQGGGLPHAGAAVVQVSEIDFPAAR